MQNLKISFQLIIVFFILAFSQVSLGKNAEKNPSDNYGNNSPFQDIQQATSDNNDGENGNDGQEQSRLSWHLAALSSHAPTFENNLGISYYPVFTNNLRQYLSKLFLKSTGNKKENKINKDNIRALGLNSYVSENNIITVGMVSTNIPANNHLQDIKDRLQKAGILAEGDTSNLLGNIEQIEEIAAGVEILANTNLLTRENFNSLLSSPQNAKDIADKLVNSMTTMTRDTHWYDDDEVNPLLNHYLRNKIGDGLMDAISLAQRDGATLAENLHDRIEYLRAANNHESQTLVLPINLGTFNPKGLDFAGNHWVALYIHNSLSTEPTIAYIDPFGERMPPRLERILQNEFSSDIQVAGLNIRFQDDTYNCGPWIVEILHQLVDSNGTYVPKEGFDINVERSEHRNLIQELSSAVQLSSEHNNKKMKEKKEATEEIKLNKNEILLAMGNLDMHEQFFIIDCCNLFDKISLRILQDLLKTKFYYGASIEQMDFYRILEILFESSLFASLDSEKNETTICEEATTNEVEKDGSNFLSQQKLRMVIKEQLPLIKQEREKIIDLMLRSILNQLARTHELKQISIEKLKLLVNQEKDIKNPEKVTDLFFLAAGYGQSEVVKLLIDKGIDINQTSERTRFAFPFKALGKSSALMEAATYGNIKVAELLIGNGADVNVANNSGWTALILASKNGHADIVKLLIENGADVSQVGSNGTALIEASSAGHVDTVKLLIANGANVNQADKNGGTALIGGSHKGYADIVKLLIESGADVNQATRNGYTPLIKASSSGDIDTVKILIENGAKVNPRRTANGFNPLDNCIFSGGSNKVAIAKLLIDSGADVKQADNYGKTPIMKTSDPEMLKLLIENGADVYQTDNTAKAALLKTSFNSESLFGQNNINILDISGKPPNVSASGFQMPRFPTKYGTDANQADNAAKPFSFNSSFNSKHVFGQNNINVLDKSGKNPNISASGFQMPRFPTKNGTDANQADNVAKPFFFNASFNNNFLVKKNINTIDRKGSTILIEVSSKGDIEEMKKLIEEGAAVNQEASYGYTALMKASSQGFVEAVQLLIENGADVNKADINGQTALMKASLSSNANCEVIELLVKNGANVDKVDKDGKTVLMLISEHILPKKAKLLIELGADVNKSDNKGWTPLMIATEAGHYGGHTTEMVKLLIEKGADVNKAACSGYTALMAATRPGNYPGHYPHYYVGNDIKMIKLLIKSGADVKQADNEGRTALMYASDRNYPETVKLLAEKGADVKQVYDDDALIEAVSTGDFETVKLLVENGVDANKADDDGQTALMYAAESGYSKMVKLLVKKGADVNRADINGWTALMYAADCGETETVGLLIELGANVNKEDNKGWTALMYAKDNDYTETADILAENGADANKQNER